MTEAFENSFYRAMQEYEQSLVYPYDYGYEDDEEYTNKYESIK